MNQVEKELLPKEWTYINPIYKRSKKEAPFCPFCGDELDSLDMHNYTSECKCGIWSDTFMNKTGYRKKPTREEVDKVVKERKARADAIAQKRKKSTYLKLKKEFEKE